MMTHRSLATAKLGCYPKRCGGLCEMALLALGIACQNQDVKSTLFGINTPINGRSRGPKKKKPDKSLTFSFCGP